MSDEADEKAEAVALEILGALDPLTRRDTWWESAAPLTYIEDIIKHHYAAAEQRPAGATAVEQGS